MTRKIGYRLAQLDLESLLAGVHLNLGEYDEAIRLYDPSSTHLSNNVPLARPSDVAYCYQLKGDYARALALYQSALKTHKQQAQPDVRFELMLLISSAECSLALGDWDSAADSMKSADGLLSTFEPHSSGDLRAATVRARLARHHGIDREAIQHVSDALTTEGRIFAAAQSNLLIPPDARTYEQLFNLLLEYSASGDQANAQMANELIFSFLENMRYRSLRNFIVRSGEKQTVTSQASEQERELLQRIQELASRNVGGKYRRQLRELYGEYEDVTLKHHLAQPQQLAIKAAKPLELLSVQKALDPETVLVEFLMVGERVVTVVISADELQCVVLPVDKQTLAAKTKLFRSLLQSSKGNEWAPVAESLRSLLFNPLDHTGAFSGKKRVGLVLSGVFNDLPFAALMRLDQGRSTFLIEDYELFQVSSATAHAREFDDAVTGGAKTVAFGLNAAVQGSAPLRFAEEEALAVAAGQGDVAHLGSRAFESELKRVAPDCDYLHLATHAVAESEMPLFSRIILQSSGSDDGSLTVREVFELGLKTQLVTLSGCETGRSYSASGTDRTDQDRIGLIEAFLHAGSRSVLSTLWPITDEPTTEFMKFFYTQLRSGRSRAQALATTQRAMLRNEISVAGAPISHPRYWAPFILSGRP